MNKQGGIMENAELIKALRCKEYFDLCNVENCRYHLTNTKSGCKCAIKLMATDAAAALEAAEKRIAELEAAQRWIPVTERLPEDGNDVLVTYLGYTDKKPYSDDVAKWSLELNGYNGGWLWSLDDSDVEVEITHWQPLPQPPQKGE